MPPRVETKTVFSLSRKAKIKKKLASFREISFRENFRFRRKVVSQEYIGVNESGQLRIYRPKLKWPAKNILG
jgi:hypothetical protein